MLEERNSAFSAGHLRQEIDTEGLLRALLLPRTIEEKMLRLVRQGRLSKWFSGYGQEAVAVGCTWALEDRDYVLPMHRNLGVWTTRNVPLRPLFCQLMGRQGGFTRGRDRTFHFGLPEKRILGMISHMAAMLPVACGLGTAARLDEQDFVALAFVGEGGSREGDFHEALNLAAVWKLPVIFVIENNGYGLSTPVEEAVAVEDLAEAASGYGMPGAVVDGNDVLAVVQAVRKAAEHARSGRGPVLLEMKTFRMRGHEEASGTDYVPDEQVKKWRKKDPIGRFTRFMHGRNLLEKEALDDLLEELVREVQDAAEFALAQPEVESTVEQERSDLFAPAFAADEPPAEPASEKRYIDAVREALQQALRQDKRVLLLGQDIAEYGGVFKVTEGLIDELGRDRIRNTPIIESGAVGAALGLALQGFKPVVEMQYADFITNGFNQIVNNLATTHYRWGHEVPVTIRAPYGGGLGAGPFHSRSMEAWFCHAPGLKVVVPATPQDAKGLLLTSIAEPNPVLFFEHKYLYRSLQGEVPDAPYHVELGRARTAREGEDATIVTYGVGVQWALEEAAYQEQESGLSVEVVDLRTLVPWDEETVLTSLEKTNRLLVLHEATYTAGFGAEVAARVAEVGFHLLDAPPVRVASEDLPVPFTRSLERDVFSAQSKLRRSLERLLAY